MTIATSTADTLAILGGGLLFLIAASTPLIAARAVWRRRDLSEASRILAAVFLGAVTLALYALTAMIVFVALLEADCPAGMPKCWA
jgi:hypothetical protein